MATKTVAGSGYGNVFLDSLIWGGKVWDQSAPIKIWLGDPNEYDAAVAGPGRAGQNGLFAELDSSTLDYWSYGGAEEYAIVYALGLFESVCGLRFDPNIASVTEADFVWWKVDIGETIAGVHENLDMFGTDQIWGYFNYMAEASWTNLHFGGDGLNTIIHEIGHGLGLAHPHDGGSQPDSTTFPGIDAEAEYASSNPGAYGYNQGVNSVMSYVPGSLTSPHDFSYGGQGGLGAFDIAALQALYGANYATATGNDTYILPTLENPGMGFGWMSIWDAGGEDTISGKGARDSVVIDLRAATLVYGDQGAGGYLSQQTDMPGGFTIAKGVTIENAIGGHGGDVLTGNSGANRLSGGAGKDILIGGGGADSLLGGAGNDRLTGGSGKDMFVFGTKLGTSKTDRKVNFDTITDYKVKDDTIQLDNAIFKKLGKPGMLNKKFFKVGDKAQDRNDYLLFDKKTGILSYDKDGSGAGEAIEIAKLQKNLKMTQAEFFVI